MPEFTSYPAGTPSWVDLQSPEPSASRAFYGAVFGWGAEELAPEAGGYTPFTKNGKWIAGCGPQMMGGASTPAYWTTYVAVDDIDASVATAESAGAQVFVPPMQVMTAGKMAVLADPVGGVFALWEAGDHKGAQLANEPGTLTWNELATRDIDASLAFYGTLFGWVGETDDSGGMAYTQWMLAGKPVGGMMAMPPMIPESVYAFWNVYFAVEDTDATVEKVTAHGGSVQMPPTDTPVGRMAVVTDPQGATFCLIKVELPAA